MFNHVLVPLDGSQLAEASLPAAAFLAGICHAKVTLLHIIEQEASPVIHGQRHLTRSEEAEAYLTGIGRRFFANTAETACHVHTVATKDVGSSIVLHEAELAPDLIVMCSHGRGGLRDLLYGRIAQQVMAAGTIPVLLIQPQGSALDGVFTCRQVLAPTDGTSRHAKGLALSFSLAATVGARLDLLSVVPTLNTLTGRHATTSRFAPGSTQAMLDIAADDLKKYLAEQVARFQKQGVATSARLEQGDPGGVIAAVADESDSDIIVVGTHGKAGTGAFWSQSVGAKLLSKSKRPILLVPE